MIWLTEYRGAFGEPFQATIQARTLAGARRLARRRGLREAVQTSWWTDRPASKLPVGMLPCSLYLTRRGTTPVDRIHAVAFLCFLALMSKTATVREVLDDQGGLLHQWIHHELFHGERPTRRRHRRIVPGKRTLLRWVRRMESRVPGMPR